MTVLRTPDKRFADLEEWPYEPKYVDVGGGLRMHYIDEGPRSADPVLLAHGEPTWGYLYRKMIPGLAAAGRRMIVPDLMGSGAPTNPLVEMTTPIYATSNGRAIHRRAAVG